MVVSQPGLDLCACDDQPVCRRDSPAAVFFYSRTVARTAAFGWLSAGWQADAYAGFNRPYEASPRTTESSRLPAGSRRGTRSSIRNKAPIAAEAVKRIDA